ncbi:hypothetical protein KO505_03955 [Psychrosphaera sp. F3M07]|uniref:hypothetical protein n=1 Tax=Psychrosphaera sp. F3M07 TaxID=2841560 RepID=UPI001C0A2B62|nr:hypothetical protein [Psychrosphaera sp. F3M07]MBU2917117.1 hypothetical protein [Psychrosphaera sp. F3M07]
MRIFDKSFFVICWFILIISPLSYAATMVQIDEINFGQLLPVAGGCEMDWDTGNIVSIGVGSLCNSNPVGTPGHYRLTVNPNENYQIRVDRREEVANDGITYQPKGRFISDLEQVDLIYNQFVTINSGASGIIDIYLGGVLFVADRLNGSLSYELNDAILIYYNKVT